MTYEASIRGQLNDGKALIKVKVFNPLKVEAGDCTAVDGLALVDTGASDFLIREKHRVALGLVSAEPMIKHEAVGGVIESVPYRTIVQICGSRLDGGSEPVFKNFGAVRTYATTFCKDVEFVIGMNCLSTVGMEFRPDGSFEILIPSRLAE